MKKLSKILLTAAMAFAVAMPCTLYRQTYADGRYEVQGGRIEFTFDGGEESSFEVYSDCGNPVFFTGGKLTTYYQDEQKIIYAEKQYGDVDVSADIDCGAKNGRIDTGIMVQAKEMGDALDNYIAWCVNIEKNFNSDKYVLKLHSFNHRYVGCFAEVDGLTYSGKPINLRVVVKNGVLYAFIDGSKRCALEYNIGIAEGYVGIRSFYCASKVDNLRIIGSGNTLDRGKLDEYIATANGLLSGGNLTPESAQRLNDALVIGDDLNQYGIDNAVKKLGEAIERAVEIKTFDELQTLLGEAQKIQNPDGKIYTINSWASFERVRSLCESFTPESSAEDISYWYRQLQKREKNLVKYLEV